MSNPPLSGLSAARMAALLTYRSRNSFESRFGRKVMPEKPAADKSAKVVHNEGNKYRLHTNEKALVKDPKDQTEFSVYSAQSYLRYQGDKFNQRSFI